MFDLFCELGATDEQVDFQVVYASAINRQSGDSPDALVGMGPLLDATLGLPKPQADAAKPLALQLSNIGHDQFIGRLGIGRIKAGVLRKNAPVGLCAGPGEPVTTVKISEIFVYNGMGRTLVEEASAGDIVMVAGISSFNIGDTIVDPAEVRGLVSIHGQASAW